MQLILCNRCSDRLPMPNGIVFIEVKDLTHPDPHSPKRFRQLELCGPCWRDLQDWIEAGPSPSLGGESGQERSIECS